MHEYDVALKDVLTSLARQTLRELTGFDVTQWRDVELPEVSNPRMDLLGETGGGHLIHIELQSTNDRQMPVRMADYGLRVYRQKLVFPLQFVLYVGEAPLRMSDALDLPQMQYRYRLMDIRDLNGDRLTESDAIGDNIVAILAGVRDFRETVRRVLGRIADLGPSRRARMFRLLMVLAGLRKMGTVIEEEAKHMPILNDINEHEVLGREYKRGMQQGELRMLLALVESRFGPVPLWARERLGSLSAPELEDAGQRVLKAATLGELFDQKAN